MNDLANEGMNWSTFQRILLNTWKPFIVDALDCGSHTRTFDDIVDMIEQNRAFVVDNGTGCFIIMEILQYPRHRTLHGAVAGGDLKALHDLEPMMHEYARVCDCKYLTVAGRPGWLRDLKGDGWKHDFVTVYKEVEQ